MVQCPSRSGWVSGKGATPLSYGHGALRKVALSVSCDFFSFVLH